MKKLPYSLIPSKQDKEGQFARFRDVFKQLHITVPFTEASKEKSMYASFVKDMLTKNKIFIEEDTIELEVGYKIIIQKSLPFKSKDLGSFTILVTIGESPVRETLLDLRAIINQCP